MLIPVKCFTCGKVIGDKYLYFQEEVIKEKRDKHINPDEIPFIPFGPVAPVGPV